MGRLRNSADVLCTKNFFFTPKMATTNISASFPHGMDAPASWVDLLENEL